MRTNQADALGLLSLSAIARLDAAVLRACVFLGDVLVSSNLVSHHRGLE